MVGALFLVFIVVLFAVGLRDTESGIGGKSVGLVEVLGVITDARTTVRQIRYFTKQSDVPVILLHVDSPGGVVTPSQEIYSELKRPSQRQETGRLDGHAGGLGRGITSQRRPT